MALDLFGQLQGVPTIRHSKQTLKTDNHGCALFNNPVRTCNAALPHDLDPAAGKQIKFYHQQNSRTAAPLSAQLRTHLRVAATAGLGARPVCRSPCSRPRLVRLPAAGHELLDAGRKAGPRLGARVAAQ